MPKITESELKTQIKTAEFSSFYFFFGEEKYLLESFTEKIIKKALGKDSSTFNEQRLDGENITIEEIYEAVESFPIASLTKCVLIKNLNADNLSNDDIKALNNLLCDLPDFCILIFSYTSLDISAKKSAKWKNFITSVKTNANWLEFVKLGNALLEKQLINWAKKLGADLTRENASKIVSLCGNDLITLKNEIQKLSAFVDNDEITEDAIEKCVIKNFETTVFLLSKSVMAGNFSEAYKQIDFLFNQKEDPSSILAVLASTYIDIYRVKVCQDSGQPVSELSKFFDYKNKEFKLTNAQKLSKNFSMTQIRKCLEVLIKTDLLLKTTQINKKILMEELITKLLVIYNKGDLL